MHVETKTQTTTTHKLHTLEFLNQEISEYRDTIFSLCKQGKALAYHYNLPKNSRDAIHAAAEVKIQEAFKLGQQHPDKP
jgi:hypothetical protein